MTYKFKPTKPPKFNPGDKVILQHADKDDPEAKEFGIMTGREYGVIVATWWNDFIGTYDCWIAFYGRRGFPKDPSKMKPYVLKYFEDSLTAWKK
mgnify:CR=1 FL=1|jgi:hypothetical protein